jgi:septal ring factor EnvC (AmiA/AmiB activator)
MPPDRATHLITAARQRHELTRAKAIRAIRQLARTDAPITFGSVARAATVSRSWLYTQTDIRDEIRNLRAATPPHAKPTTVPATQRASTESLRKRLTTMQARIHNLVEENQRLRNQLAVALGEQRASATPSRQDPITLQ